MEPLDLMIEIERYMSTKGLSQSDSITDLIEALAEEESE
jgi:hypothetical protein